MFPRASISVFQAMAVQGEEPLGTGKWRAVTGLHVMTDRLGGPDMPSFSSCSVPASLCSQQPRLTGTAEGMPPVSIPYVPFHGSAGAHLCRTTGFSRKLQLEPCPRFSWTGLVAVSLSPAILRLVKSSFLHPTPWKGCFPDRALSVPILGASFFPPGMSASGKIIDKENNVGISH